LKNFHLLSHEYFHYWHNFSTVCGVKLFGNAQHLLADFSMMLNPNLDGTSLGSEALSPERRKLCSEWLTLRAGLEGQPGPEVADDASVVDFEITEIELDHHSETSLGGDEVPNPLAEISVRTTLEDGTVADGSFVLGAHAIEEGIAMLVERAIAACIENAESPPVPCYPYLVLERVVRGAVDPSVSSFTIAALGTLALLTTHAGPMLIVFCNEMHDAIEQGATEQAALETLIELSRTVREHDIALARSIGAHQLERHRGRSLTVGAVEYFCAQMNAALDERVTDPIYDIRGVFLSENPRSWLIQHMGRFPSCNIHQEEVGPDDQVGRDQIVGEPVPVSSGFSSSECARTIHAQQDFVLAHIDIDCREYMPSSRASSCCPYFTVCTRRLRIEQPSVCGTRPWESLHAPEGYCWYAAAVLETLHPVELRHRAQPGEEGTASPPNTIDE
jgi:hypothetical protein